MSHSIITIEKKTYYGKVNCHKFIITLGEHIRDISIRNKPRENDICICDYFSEAKPEHVWVTIQRWEHVEFYVSQGALYAENCRIARDAEFYFKGLSDAASIAESSVYAAL